MPGKTFTFREVLEAACRSYPELWRDDESGTPVLNLAAVERHYRKRGFAVTQPNLYRLMKKRQRPGQKIIDATEGAFGVPRAILRGESLSEPMERLLGKASLETLLLAERIEALERDDARQILELLGHLEEKREQLRKAIAGSPNVRELPRRPQP